ncbi:MAG: hypothetical protein IPO99_10160 [Nitrospira sp.]|nr:hypothetical protein [Nitrospira sp.]
MSFSNAIASKSPKVVGNNALAARRTNVSRCMRYSINALIVTIFNLCRLATYLPRTRAIVPPWFMISQMTPAG